MPSPSQVIITSAASTIQAFAVKLFRWAASLHFILDNGPAKLSARNPREIETNAKALPSGLHCSSKAQNRPAWFRHGYKAMKPLAHLQQVFLLYIT